MITIKLLNLYSSKIKHHTMKAIILSLLTTVFLFSCQEEVSPNSPENIWKRHNNGNGSGDLGSGDDANNTTDAPIDGGLGFLLVAGAAYGVKRIREQKAQKHK
jgi:hypothetical protein